MKSQAFSISNVFGDHMVLQRGKPVRVTGFAYPGSHVSGLFRGESDSSNADATGKWLLEFPAGTAGGPFELVVIAQEYSIYKTFHDVLVGDVWFCSGQSNMEFPVWGPGEYYRLRDGLTVAAAAHDDSLRLLQIPKGISPEEPCAELPLEPRWASATTPEAVSVFSAVGYHFGTALREKLGDVPIGLVNGSWGGSGIETWISRRAYIANGLQAKLTAHDEALMRVKTEGRHKGPDFCDEYRDWIENKFFKYAPEKSAEALACWAKPDADLSDWRKCGGKLSDELKHVGIVWLRCHVKLPKHWEGKQVQMRIDSIDDCDDTFLDGDKIGGVDAFTFNFWNTPRNYVTVLRDSSDGTHVVAIRHMNQFANGSASGVKLCLAGTNEELVLDNAEWLCKTEFQVDDTKIGLRPSPSAPSPDDDVFSYQFPSTLYNAMVAPVTDMNICGVIWYQGCHNSSDPTGYATLQRVQIDDWRRAWRDPKLPFIITQLASFHTWNPGNPFSDDFWKDELPDVNPGFAPLREIQEAILDYPNAGVACTIDIGDHSDIHPANKKDVGLRLAHEALRIAYGDASSLPGPRFESAKREGAGVRIKFKNIGSGLETRGGGFGPHLFALAGVDGELFWAEAELAEDNSVYVHCTQVKEPCRVHYAFSGWQPGPNFYRRGDGLPVFPFRCTLLPSHQS